MTTFADTLHRAEAANTAREHAWSVSDEITLAWNASQIMGDNMFGIYAEVGGRWQRIAHVKTAGDAAYMFLAATQNGDPYAGPDRDDIAADLETGSAFERQDTAGVRGLVVSDDSPYAPKDADIIV